MFEHRLTRLMEAQKQLSSLHGSLDLPVIEGPYYLSFQPFGQLNDLVRRTLDLPVIVKLEPTQPSKKTKLVATVIALVQLPPQFVFFTELIAETIAEGNVSTASWDINTVNERYQAKGSLRVYIYHKRISDLLRNYSAVYIIEHDGSFNRPLVRTKDGIYLGKRKIDEPMVDVEGWIPVCCEIDDNIKQ